MKIFAHQRLQRAKTLSFFIAVCLLHPGCNLFSKFDKPKSDGEIVVGAQAKMDAGLCGEAVKELNDLKSPSNATKRLKGWAALCAGNAGLKKILTSIVSYAGGGSSSNGLSTVSTLAATLIPQNTSTINSIQTGIDSFNSQDASKEKDLNVALGYLIKSAALMAKATSDNKTVKRADIAPGACVGVDCSVGFAACTEVNMSDGDANTFLDAITAAGTTVGSSAGLGSIGNLTGDLKAKLPSNANLSAATAQATRCAIVNSVLKE